MLALSFVVANPNAFAGNDKTLEALERVSFGPGAVKNAPLKDILTSRPGEPSTVGNLKVTLPQNSGQKVRAQSDMTEVSVSLPFSEAAIPGKQLKPGVVAYDNGNGSTTVPVVKNDGTVQISTVIEDQTAPSRYAYDFALPENATIVEVEGGLFFQTSDGGVAGGVAPAWAVDANGAAVPTHYEVDGSTITQVVEHSSEVVYPVVADPLWGTDLISSVGWISRDGQVSLSIYPTGWNQFNFAFGPAIIESWNETIAKTPYQYVNGRWYGQYAANTTQMRWQHDCHQIGAPYKTPWNIEPWRWRGTYQDYVWNLCN